MKKVLKFIGVLFLIFIWVELVNLSFYLNDEPHGSSMIAFSKLPKGVYYPAFSLNKNVEITVNSGLEPPLCMDSADSD